MQAAASIHRCVHITFSTGVGCESDLACDFRVQDVESAVFIVDLQVVMAASHELVLAVLPAVDELRSTTARVALQLLQELPAVLGRSLERELEDIVPVLLKKAGELSTAGALHDHLYSACSNVLVHAHECFLYNNTQNMLAVVAGRCSQPC